MEIDLLTQKLAKLSGKFITQGAQIVQNSKKIETMQCKNVVNGSTQKDIVTREETGMNKGHPNVTQENKVDTKYESEGKKAAYGV